MTGAKSLDSKIVDIFNSLLERGEKMAHGTHRIIFLIVRALLGRVEYLAVSLASTPEMLVASLPSFDKQKYLSCVCARSVVSDSLQPQGL